MLDPVLRVTSERFPPRFSILVRIFFYATLSTVFLPEITLACLTAFQYALYLAVYHKTGEGYHAVGENEMISSDRDMKGFPAQLQIVFESRFLRV